MKNGRSGKFYLTISIVLVLLTGSAVTYAYSSGLLDPLWRVSGITEEDEEITQKVSTEKEDPVADQDKRKRPKQNDPLDLQDDAFSSEGSEAGDSVRPAYPEEGDREPLSDTADHNDPANKEGHWEYRDVLVSEAWDERVLIQDGYMEKVLIEEAWDEEVTYCAIFGSTMVEMEVCNSCGARFQGGINEHLSETGHSGWHNEYIAIDEPHCQSYDSYYIHHDAIYQEVWHDPEYTIVHHEAVYRTERYWVSD